MRGRLALVVVVAALAAAAVLRPTAPFTADAGPKLLQAKAFASLGGLPRTVPYPAAQVDPDRRFIPPFTVPMGDGLVSVYPVLFPVLAAAPVAALGERGAWLLPFAAAVAAAWLAGRVTRGLAGGDAALPAAVVLGATPLAFYALTLWEQTLAAALLLAAVALVVGEARRWSPVRWAGVGALLGAAFWVRTETAVALPLLAVPLLARRWRPAAAASAAAAVALVAGAAAQRVLLGAWWPLHLGYHAAPLLGGPGPVRDRVDAFAAAFVPEPFTAAATALWLAALAAALHPRWRDGRVARGLGLGAAAAALAAAAVAPAARWLAGASPTQAFPFASPAATWLPVAALPLALAGAPASSRADRRLWGVAGAAAWYLIAVTVAKPARSPEWGLRVLLPAAVLLTVVVLVLGKAGSRRTRVVVVLSVLAGVAVQGLGVALDRHGSAVHTAVVGAVLERTAPGGLVVTDTPILVLGSGTAFTERRFLFCASDGCLRAAAARIAEAGERELVAATVPGLAGGRFRIDPVLGEGCGEGWRLEMIRELPAGRHTLTLATYRRPGRAAAW